MADLMDEMAECIPASPEAEIPWSRMDRILPPSWVSGMKTTRQNPAYHGEGDVYTHTQMVCRELTGNPAFYQLTAGQRSELFLAAVLHDIGKVKTTRMENGEWISPHHASTGSRMARAFLWGACGICGTRERIAYRETVCTLIRYHMLPVYLMDREEPERKVREAAAAGELAEDFSWRLLGMLAEADVKGRTAEDTEEELSQVELSMLMAKEAGCLDAPYPFPGGFTRRAYLSGRNVQPDQALYDDTWGEVILLSGLPGTGKDTWIGQNHSDLPMVSLDGFREELDVKPTENQGEVIQAALGRAREFLRKKQPFIWNATNLTKDTRQRTIRLIEQYGARARIVYLETDQDTRRARNAGRADPVPENAVAGMLEKTVPPMPGEAQAVEWICT